MQAGSRDGAAHPSSHRALCQNLNGHMCVVVDCVYTARCLESSIVHEEVSDTGQFASVDRQLAMRVDSIAIAFQTMCAVSGMAREQPHQTSIWKHPHCTWEAVL